MKLIFTFFFFTVCSAVFAQVPLPQIEEIGENKGLYLNDDVADVKIDSEGFAWIISFSEIYRYDGDRFFKINTSTTSHNSFIKFNETPDKKKYITDLSGNVFFIVADTLKPYRHNDKILKHRRIVDFMEVRFDSIGNLTALPHCTGIIKVENDSMSVIKLDEGLNIVFQDDELPLFSSQFPDIDGYKVDISKEEIFLLFDENYHLLDTISIKTKRKTAFYRSLIRTGKERFLFSFGVDKILEFYQKKLVKTYHFDYSILNMFYDFSGNLWVSTKSKGLHFFKDGIINMDEVVIYFPNDSYIVSAEDQEGGIWGYSEKNGVFRIGQIDQVYFNEESGFNEFSDIGPLAKVDDELYFGKNNNQVGRLQLKTNKISIEKLSSTKNQSIGTVGTLESVQDLEYDKKNKRLWLAQRQQIRFKEKNEWKNLDHAKFRRPAAEKNFLADYKEGQPYSIAGTHFRCFFICDQDSVRYVSEAFPDKVFGVLMKNDSVFVNARNGIYLSYKEKTSYLGDVYPQLNRRIIDWAIWGNKVWVSTRNSGVYILKEDSLEKVIFNGYDPQSARFVYQNDSSFWLFSGLGNIQITNSNWKEHFKVYNPLPNIILNDIKVDGNRVYASTKKSGLLQLDLEKLKKQPLKAVNLYISKLMIGAKVRNLNDSVYNCKYNENTIKFWFYGINYENWETQFRYRLHGFQNNWVNTNERNVEFIDLSAGNYTFELQAKKGEQMWGDSQQIKFKIAPPFWETYWFIGLVILFIGLLFYSYFAIKSKRDNREKLLKISQLKSEQRALRAKMDPHFMFNVISSLEFLVANNMNEKASKFLQQFSFLMRSTLDQTNLEFVAIVKEKNFLNEYIKLERLRLEERFDYEITISPELDEESLIPNFLIQPFIENAIHHGLKIKEGRGFLSVTFSKKNEMVKVVIEDNGMGYNDSLASKTGNNLGRKSYGISTVEERLKLRNGKNSVIIKDLSDIDTSKTGTRVTLYIKIEKP